MVTCRAGVGKKVKKGPAPNCEKTEPTPNFRKNRTDPKFLIANYKEGERNGRRYKRKNSNQRTNQKE